VFAKILARKLRAFKDRKLIKNILGGRTDGEFNDKARSFKN
jgi:hypothetical protein